VVSEVDGFSILEVSVAKNGVYREYKSTTSLCSHFFDVLWSEFVRSKITSYNKYILTAPKCEQDKN
jgi:hypothetical protein